MSFDKYIIRRQTMERLTLEIPRTVAEYRAIMDELYQQGYTVAGQPDLLGGVLKPMVRVYADREVQTHD